MTPLRYKQIMDDDKVNLTPEEIAQGWHFCYEFDGLLRQPMDESDVLGLKGDGTTTAFKCTCFTLVDLYKTRCDAVYQIF